MNSIKERFDSMDGTQSEAVQKIQARFPSFKNHTALPILYYGDILKLTSQPRTETHTGIISKYKQ